MYRFVILGFPVEVRWQFWLTAALLSGLVSANSPQDMLMMFTGMAVVFVSILAHELGHAFAMRHFGDGRVAITLYAMGGFAQGMRWLTRTQDVIVSAAGPVVSLLLGIGAWYFAVAFDHLPWLASVALSRWIYVNIVWSLINLLPVIPLDGGRISAAMFGPSRTKMALQVSVGFAVAAALLFLFAFGHLFSAVFFGMLAWNNWQRLQQGSEIPWMR